VTDRKELREQIIHGLRMQGWSRIEAENEADERLFASDYARAKRTNNKEG
jgi:hypothetical protein